MKQISRTTIIFLSVLFFISCSRPQQSMQAQISGMEKELFKDSSFIPDPSKADSIIKMYINYADQYPDDTLSPEYLFRAGDIANGTGKPKDALTYFGRISRYPNYRKAGTAVFLQGFISENYLGDMEGAKKYYEKFLRDYPNHKMVPDAKASLNNLGKTPEEMVKEFEERMNASKDSVH